MDVLTGPALLIAALLVVAGAPKAIDPTMTVGALRALRLPSSPAAVRVGSLAEAMLGASAVVVGGPVLWTLVAASYAAFGVFVLAAMRAGTMIGSCGCFGRDDTPPHPIHVGLDLALAATAVAAALALDRAPVDELASEPGSGVVVALLAALGLYLAYATFVELPRTLAEGRPG